MDNENLLLTVAVIAVVASLIGFTSTYTSVNSFKNHLTGYAVENGTVNLTITSVASINITEANNTEGSKTLDWADGSVSAGKDYAILVTNGTVTDGSWSPISKGFIIENIGNKNVSLSIYSDDDAATFIGSSLAEFKYNFTNNESNSCASWNSTYTEGTFVEFTTSAANICDNFQNVDDRDSLRLDLFLKVPSEAAPDSRSTIIRLVYN